MKIAIIAVSVTLVLTSCQSTGQKEGMGTLLGGALGGLAGSQIGGGKGKMAAIGAGVLLGAIMGNSAGASLDKADQLAMQQTSQKSLEVSPDGRATAWRNPNNGNSGTVVPTQTYERQNGQYCREFTQTINVGGKTQSAYGTACRQPDGTWKIIQWKE